MSVLLIKNESVYKKSASGTNTRQTGPVGWWQPSNNFPLAKEFGEKEIFLVLFETFGNFSTLEFFKNLKKIFLKIFTPHF